MATLEQVVRDRLNERWQLHKEALFSGVPQDYAAYRELVGYQRAVYHCMEDILPLIRKAQQEEDGEGT